MDFGTLWGGFWKGLGRPKSSILALFSQLLVEKSYQKSSEKKIVEKNRKITDFGGQKEVGSFMMRILEVDTRTAQGL